MRRLITAKELRAECKKEIKALQKVCKHPTSVWCEESWAPGHLTGRRLKICNACEKVLESNGTNWQEANK